MQVFAWPTTAYAMGPALPISANEQMLTATAQTPRTQM